MTQKTLILFLVLFLSILPRPVFLHASEVLEDTDTQVVVRHHPKTGRPYVSITSPEKLEDPFTNARSTYARPDYRMLDPKVKSGQIPYDGPYTSSKKVYVFAASLATLGTVGSAVGFATIPLASTTSAAGAGTYFAASGTALATGAAATVAATKSNPKSDDFVQTAIAENTRKRS
ncbi:MAG: hypothetical protein A3G87_01500 [Omnitrophica bacterium RIFCSPLOWO2_12_FULL_50_11]|nr:MAG: hypothetical protein A3G87_01500 [Omnitrophica bacterium RIFCSPLOWO2_12_FULL_50_11]